MKNGCKILSVDGGGVRGLIPALVMTEIERRTGESIGELFDLIAGTSTGGLLALGVGLPKPANGTTEPYSAEGICELYTERGDEIFDRSAWHAMRALDNWSEEKYPSEGLREVLQAQFGEATLSDAPNANLLITSYALERRKPYFFKSHRVERGGPGDFPAWKIGYATSAAPTYFEPCKISLPDSDDYYSLVDGGVFANNPAMCALAEALDAGYPPERIRLVSLGTGELTRRIDHDEASDWGVARWTKPLLDVSFDGVADTVDYQVRRILPDPDDGPRHYYRLQTRLTEGSDSLDDASATNLRVLRLRAETLIDEHHRELEELCEQLTESGG